MNKYLVVLFSFLCYQASCQQLRIRSVLKSYDPYIVRIQWLDDAFDKSTVGFNTYVEEGIVSTFPNTFIDSLSGAARGWESEPRRKIDFLNTEVRPISDWMNKKILTKGNHYTIGIERLYIDALTKKKKKTIKKVFIFPFTLIKNELVGELPLKEDEIALANYESVAIEMHQYLFYDKGELRFKFDQHNHKVLSILQGVDFLYYKLDNQYYLRYDLPPRRPLPTGDIKFVKNTFGVIIFSFVFISSLIIIIALIKALIYYNILVNNSLKSREILSEILNKEFLSVIIIFLLIFLVSNNIVNVLLSKIIPFAINVEMDNNEKLFSDIKSIYNANSIMEMGSIREKILSLLDNV